MADEIKTSVQQESYFLNTDGSLGKVRLNRRGEVVVVNLYDQLVADGRVFMVSNAARETAAACGSVDAFDDTDPAALLDIPEGTTAIPLEIIFNQGGTVAGGNITYLITLSDKVRYVSGGAAITPQNMRFDEPRGSNCKFWIGTTDIVANANTDDLTLWGDNMVHDIDALAGKNINWSARNYISPVLVGPAAIPIYAVAATTQPSYFFVVKWAEFATTEVKQV